MEAGEIIALMKNSSEADQKLIERAFIFAKKAHTGHLRASGEDYFIHPVAVAKNLAEMRMDATTIAAGLLHDTVEDELVTEKEITTRFGPEVLFLVQGVTKLGRLKYQGLKRHAESLRKMFVAMAKDIRVLMIRFADRLHNVQTLKHLTPEKQKRIADETIEIYAPLANRLGMWRIKGLLEDAAFPFAYPAEYKKVVTLRKTKGKETIKKLQKLYRTLHQALTAQGITDVTVDYRVKYLYSLYQKLVKNQMDISQIYDISAMRIIVPTVSDCYRVLGIVHSVWKPLPGKLKDYIAHPKPNGYQSIHTTVFTGNGGSAEIQIRTREMNEEAEFGVTSHIYYDEAGKPRTGGRLTKKLHWIEHLIQWQKHIKESEEFLTALKTDFFKDQIFIFTPKGDVVELPAGSTPIDFAYRIHTDIGDHTAGAKVNGKMVHLDYQLKNNDLVEIDTRKNAHPSTKWLDHTRTTFARKQIRLALKKT